MSDEQRAWLALLLMVLVLAVWAKFYHPGMPEKPAGPSAPVASAAAKAPAAAPAVPQTATSASPESAAAGTTAVKQAGAERTITVESGLYRVEISNRGAAVRSWQLKKYRSSDTPPKQLDLVNAPAAQQVGGWPLSLKLDDPQLEAEANSALFVSPTKAATLEAPAEVDFQWSDGHLSVSKQMKFGKGYQAEISVAATLDGRLLPVGLAWRGGFGDTSVYEEAEKVEIFYQQNGKLEVLPYKKLGESGHAELPAAIPGSVELGGIEDLYFTAAFLPNSPGMTLSDWTQQESVTADGKTSQQPLAEMTAGTAQPGPWSLRLYVGPKDLTELGKLEPPLTGLVQFGYLGFIAKPLLWILKWIHRYIPNYGWAIVLMTVVINMLLFPLKVKSWRSMQRMRRVQPKMEAIKQKYAKYSMRDPRRREMNEEMMALYKEEGVNPMGGCLPTLIQMPIWWGLYRMLLYSIELRHAPWILWIHDLSARDPYYILTILMALTMYFTMKMTPQTMTDPTQQKMMAFMPIMFAGIFFIIPVSCGLILYILTQNVVGIAQQWYLNKTEPLPSRSKFKKKPASA